MSEARTFRLRVTFTKQGRLAMLSHLELARALERGVRRSGLPFAVTQGFSPHMRIGYGAALPVGIGGTAEIFDIYLQEYRSPAKALADLQAAFPADLAPYECHYVDLHAEAASVAVPICTYEAVLSEAPRSWRVPDSISVVRKKKEKTLTVSEYLVGPMEIDGATVRFTLESRPTGSLRPDALMAECLALSVAAGAFDGEPSVVRFTRIAQHAASQESAV